ncbi:MAG: proprionate catabolism activator, Fis family [Firmicutes bacterium]|nr:proprionate catabolism activator, Fis family [Bacillota bacterium]
MSRIAFIAPDKRLFYQGQKIIQELGLQNSVELHLARLNRGIKLAKKLEHEDVDVIVCRGGTAQVIIDSGVRIPVVEIAITGQDLAQVFYEAKRATGEARPKVAVLAYKNMIYDIEVLSRILEIDLTIYPLVKADDIPTQIDAVSKTDTKIVVGGRKTILLAEKAGLIGLPISSGDFSVRNAFLEAQKIVMGRQIEKEQAQEFKTLVDHSTEGIISINTDQVIKVFNPTAERLLQQSAKDILGRTIAATLPFIHVESCLKDGLETVGQVRQLGPIWISFSIAPIRVDERITGAIITFQDITRIQEMEAKIRNEVLARRMIAEHRFADILGVSPQITEVKRIAHEIAAVDATVLIYGETGTGKEFFAQSIHNSSPRGNGPFVAVNCAALPPNLLESELFGYVEGAFTGATKKGKQGLFEMAHRGTIFLDEISEMDKYGQSRLLRVLQEKQVMRLGDDKYIPVDIRIIAATNKNLLQLVKDGQFRQDLFYRLKVLTIKLPPLRKRSGDIQELANHFLDRFNLRHHKHLEFTATALNAIANYNWPGNVRELMYFIERLVVICREKKITATMVQHYWEDSEFSASADLEASTVVPESEAERIIHTLEECSSNITQAAARLGMDRTTLYRKLKAYKIEVKKTY